MVSTAANELGILQICVSHSPGLAVEEGVSSTWSFSCGWSLPEAFPQEDSLILLKCELTPRLFPKPGFSPASFHELFTAPLRPLLHHEICCQSRGLGKSLDCMGGWLDMLVPVEKQNKISYPIRTMLNLY